MNLKRIIPRRCLVLERASRHSWTARCPATNSAMSGESRSVAIAELRAYMWTEFLSLKDDPDSRLGPAMRAKKQGLISLFQKFGTRPAV